MNTVNPHWKRRSKTVTVCRYDTIHMILYIENPKMPPKHYYSLSMNLVKLKDTKLTYMAVAFQYTNSKVSKRGIKASLVAQL